MVDAVALNRGAITGQAIGAAGTATMDAVTADKQNLTVQVVMTGAASGDLAVAVSPLEPDGTTVSALTLTPAVFSGPTFGAGAVRYFGRFDVRGFDKVRITLTNNNVGAQTITRAQWRVTGDDS